MMWQIRKMKDDLVGGLIGLIVAILIGTYTYSQQDFIKASDNPKGVHVVKHGDVFEYCRNVKYLKDSNATLDKSIIKYENGEQMVIIAYNTHSLHREAGFEQKVCKRLDITKLMDKGSWVIETYITRKQLPLWTKTVKLKDIHLEVKE